MIGPCGGAWRRRPTAASSPARTTTPSRCGATARASAPSRRTMTLSGGGGAAGRSALRQRLERRHREAVDARRRSRAHLRGGRLRVLRRGAARRRALCGRPWQRPPPRARSGCTTSTGRSSTPSRGTPATVCARGGGDARRPAHHQRLWARQGVERRQQEPREHLHRAHQRRYAVAAMPDGQRILSGGDDDTVRVWLLDGTLENTFRAAQLTCLRPRGAARQPARALRLVRQDRQALQRQRRRRPAHLQAHTG